MKFEPSYIPGGTVNNAATLENSLAVPQKVKHRDLAVPLGMDLEN